jgi:hypothetical protein
MAREQGESAPDQSLEQDREQGFTEAQIQMIHRATDYKQLKQYVRFLPGDKTPEEIEARFQKAIALKDQMVYDDLQTYLSAFHKRAELAREKGEGSEEDMLGKEYAQMRDTHADLMRDFEIADEKVGTVEQMQIRTKVLKQSESGLDKRETEIRTTIGALEKQKKDLENQRGMFGRLFKSKADQEIERELQMIEKKIQEAKKEHKKIRADFKRVQEKATSLIETTDSVFRGMGGYTSFEEKKKQRDALKEQVAGLDLLTLYQQRQQDGFDPLITHAKFYFSSPDYFAIDDYDRIRSINFDPTKRTELILTAINPMLDLAKSRGTIKT